MQVALSDLKVNVGKYVDLAETTDVIITKYGKPIAKYLKTMPAQVTSIEQLFGTLPSDIDYEDVKAGADYIITPGDFVLIHP